MLSAVAVCRTPRRKFWSPAGSVARTLGVQSRKIWQVITGLLSATLEPSKTWENPHIRQRFCSPAVNVSNTVITIASTFPRSYSYGHYYVPGMRVWTTTTVCVCCYDVCVYAMCVCSVYVCACVRVCHSVVRVGKGTYM